MSAFGDALDDDARELNDIKIAADLAERNREALGQGVNAAYQNRDAAVEFVGRHGSGIQRPIDWEAPHDDFHRSAGPRAAASSYIPSQEELNERWNRALREEQQLLALKAEVEAKERAASATIRRLTPNFPVKFLCVSPVVHHDILADIPVPRQLTVKIAYGNWWATCGMLVVNFVLCLIILLLPTKSDDPSLTASIASQHVGLSVAYLAGIPMSFMTWYWQMYKAARTGHSATYVAGFVGLVIGFLFCAFMALGYPGLGGAGAMFASSVSQSKGKGPAIPIAIMTVLWAKQAFVFIYLMVKFRQFYVEDGASIEEAQRQVTASAVRTYRQHAI